MPRFIAVPLPKGIKIDGKDAVKAMIIDVDKVICAIEYEEVVMLRLPEEVQIFGDKEIMYQLLALSDNHETVPIPDAFIHMYNEEFPKEPEDVFEGNTFWEKYGTSEE